MLSFWWRPLGFALGLAFFSLLLSSGRPPGTGWALFSAGLLVYLIYHLRQLRKLTEWLAADDRPALSADGLWGDALYRLEKLLRSRKGAQQKAAADLEQMLEATRNLPDGVVILDRSKAGLATSACALRRSAMIITDAAVGSGAASTSFRLAGRSR